MGALPTTSLTQDRAPSDLAPALAVPPGKSPFHVKGLVIHGLFRYLEQRVPGGPARVIASIEDPVIREYVQQPFLAASLYDLFPYLHAVATAGIVAGVPVARFAGEHCAWQAERDVRGVYRLLLKLASPEAAAARLGHAWKNYFDFASIVPVSVKAGASVHVVERMPSVFVGWFKAAVRPAGDMILGLAGARDIKVAFTAPEPDGQTSGFPLSRFEIRRTWTR